MFAPKRIDPDYPVGSLDEAGALWQFHTSNYSVALFAEEEDLNPADSLTIAAYLKGENTMTIARDDDGKFPTYAWPGGYPIFYICDDGALCPDCANEHGHTDPPNDDFRIFENAINWEDDSLFCDHCNAQIESAYGEDGEEPSCDCCEVELSADPPLSGDANNNLCHQCNTDETDKT